MQEATAIVKASDYELDEASAIDINTSFKPMVTERDLLAKQYADIVKLDIDEHTSRKAGVLRRKLVKVRTGIASVHKTQKHMFLMAGKFVDAVKNVQTLPVTQMEEKLSEIEKHQENIELEKIRKVRDTRTKELWKYGVDESMLPAHLGQMEEAVYTNYLAGVKEADRLLQEKNEKAEAERIAEEEAAAAEQERVRLENVKLKKEAEVARKKQEVADAKIKTERDKRERLEKEKSDSEAAALKEKEATAAREKDKTHRSAVDVAIIEAMMVAGGSGVSQGASVLILQAIVAGKIKYVSVNY